MQLFQSLDRLAGGLNAQRTRLDVASANLANARTTQTPEGGAYQRRLVSFAESLDNEGVEVAEIVADTKPPRMVYEPGHPDADAQGMVAYPDISVMEEMVDMISASRAYEAGVTAMNSVVSMAQQALAIGRGG